jgi:hypothetical protein
MPKPQARDARRNARKVFGVFVELLSATASWQGICTDAGFAAR